MISNVNKMPSPIGAVFTPLNYARETVENCGLYEKWRKGAIILDPTAGAGNFIEAFIKIATSRGERITRKLLKNLYAVEMQPNYISDFHRKIKKKYNVEFPEENFVCGDYLFTDTGIEADYLLGNPPWLNFCDLEPEYKKKIKHFFLETGLAGNKKELLLGSSRIDIAALIIYESIRKNLKDNGEALFYLPLSLFLNDGAHKGFRSILNNGTFSLNYIHDYKNYSVFPDVSTRYGFASFTKSEKTEYPVDYLLINEQVGNTHNYLSPMGERDSPYIIHSADEKWNIPLINIDKKNKPRQGLNTCGANRLYIFDTCEILKNKLVRVKNKEITAILPEELIYPLIGAGQFRGEKKHRFVFLPYNINGKVLSGKELSKYPEALNYLEKHKFQLSNRKGVLIQNSIKKGYWWALLGIGPYSFAPWKIVWEAFGKKEFRAGIFTSQNGKSWQPNQALQAFIPLDNKKEAERINGELKNPLIEKILINQGMEGTCNWAQPGRMMRFFNIRDKN